MTDPTSATDDLEMQLRATLARHAAEVPDDLVPPIPSPAASVVRLPPAIARRRPVPLLAAAAAVVVALVGVGLVAARAGDGDTPLASGPATSDPTATGPATTGPGPTVAEAAGPRPPIWPTTDPGELPTFASDPRLQSPAEATHAYLSSVAGLPEDWPLDEPLVDGHRAVVPYVLQDLAAQVDLEQGPEGAWHVVGASNEVAPLSGVTRSGDDVVATIGPSGRGSGWSLRLVVLDQARRQVSRIAATMGDAGAKTVTVRGPGAAVLEVDALEDHDEDPGTPDVVVAHSAAAVGTTAGHPTLPVQDGRRLPEGYDARTARPVFTADGTGREVVQAWLADRFPDQDGFVISDGVQAGEGLSAWRWTIPAIGEVARGQVVLRRDGDREVVVYALADRLSLAGLRHEAGRVVGAAETTGIDSLFADVLRPDGGPVVGAARPGGWSGGAHRFGTAAGPADTKIVLDVPVGPDEGWPLVRVSEVGGTILSVSELVLPPA